VSVEWIDHYISTNKKVGGELYRHLRCQKKRRKRYGSVDKRGRIKNRVSIDERSAIVDLRQRVGDGEMDLIIGRIGGSVLMTAVERKTRYTLIGFAPNKTAKEVKDCMLDVMDPLASLHTLIILGNEG
jgi:IS30 family transposase